MKRLGFFLLAAAFAINAGGQQTPQHFQEDPYGISLVQYLIQSNSGSLRITDGTFERHVPELGDRVSICLLKLYSEQDLLKPENVRAYLPLIKESYSSAGMIAHQEDVKPSVTLFLLHYLDRNLKDAALRKGVTDLESQLSKMQASPTQNPH
jgi:hypothetical protein